MSDTQIVFFTASDLKAGDMSALEKLYAEYRPAFIPWAMDRWGFSDHYAEETLVETTLAFRNMVDEGKLDQLPADLKGFFFSLGAAVGNYVASYAFPSFHLSADNRKEMMTAADQKHGIHLVQTGWEPPKGEQINFEMEAIAAKVANQLNPECRKLMQHYARTSLTPEQLSRVLNYSSSRGLTSMKDLCIERFTKLVNEELARSGKK